MSTSMTDEKYRVVAPEAMHETFMSDSEEEGPIALHVFFFDKLPNTCFNYLQEKILQLPINLIDT
jgi:hypothetical protein